MEISFRSEKDKKLYNNSKELLKKYGEQAHEINGGKAFVTLPEDQKSLAIGKWASNIRIAGELTGYQIELK